MTFLTTFLSFQERCVQLYILINEASNVGSVWFRGSVACRRNVSPSSNLEKAFIFFFIFFFLSQYVCHIIVDILFQPFLASNCVFFFVPRIRVVLILTIISEWLGCLGGNSICSPNGLPRSADKAGGPARMGGRLGSISNSPLNGLTRAVCPFRLFGNIQQMC